MEKSYQGSCHCGAVRYSVNMNPPEKVFAGNCSMCKRAGWLLAFVPKAAFTLAAGEESLRDYQFGKMRAHHLFCTTCGVRPFSRGTNPKGEEIVVVNLRCVADLDPTTLPVHNYDCAAL